MWINDPPTPIHITTLLAVLWFNAVMVTEYVIRGATCSCNQTTLHRAFITLIPKLTGVTLDHVPDVTNLAQVRSYLHKLFMQWAVTIW